MEKISQHRCFDGTLTYYRHFSLSTQCSMRFSLYKPPKPTNVVLIYLSGLTCTEENFTVKAGAYRNAAKFGLNIIALDTSPRGENIANDPEKSLGFGASYYVDATEAPWNKHYKMYSYVAEEIPNLLSSLFSSPRLGLFGHSMGGHGALTIGLKHPDRFLSLSAFAPICTPSKCGGGLTAFPAYLGNDKSTWQQYDATALIENNHKTPFAILIDQGLADEAYLTGRLNPEAFVSACEKMNQPVIYRTHPEYDHNYFFVQSFIDDHLSHHAKILRDYRD